MMTPKIPKTWVVLLLLLSAGTAFAAHPLITDDAGTQGKGGWQIELNGEYSHDNQNSVSESEFQIAATLTYGVTDNIDLAIGLPYLRLRSKEAGETVSASGFSDIPVYAKWRFYEKDGLSIALKPGITLPAGDEEKELGGGKVTCSIFMITTKEAKPWAFHLNLGYIRNDNAIDEVKDLWHVSLASEFEAAKGLRLVANVGVEHTREEESNVHPVFLLGGLIYSISKDLDIDVGIKGGLNRAEPDYTLMAGTTWRF